MRSAIFIDSERGWPGRQQLRLGGASEQGRQDVICGSAPAHATLAQPAAGADALKDLRAQRAQDIR